LREFDTRALQAATDEKILNQFIEENEFFILKCVSSITHRYITKNDDEWSLALVAFNKAIQSYDFHKGSFASFAEMIIRNQLIDHYRGQFKYKKEIAVNPKVFDTESNEDDENLHIRLAVVDKVHKNQDNTLQYEIHEANQAFANFGFSFYDLSECSPKAEKTKKSCAKAVVFLLKNPLLIEEIYNLKQLPLKIIEKNAKVPRKILERHRKYIIAAVEILSGEYPGLAEYMRFIRKELD